MVKPYNILSLICSVVVLLCVPLNAQLYQRKNPIAVDISFGIADIKLNDSVKVLEFGQGIKSRFDGLDNLYGYGTAWSSFWHYLQQFNLPIWYVDPKLNAAKRQQDIAFDTFKNLPNTHYARGLHELTHDKKFKACMQQTTIAYSPDIASYQAIVILRRVGKIHRKQLKKQYPQCIVVDAATMPFFSNKQFSSELFQDTLLQAYKPQWHICPTRYRSDLAAQIIEKMACDYYVIKPISAAKGHGVLMVSQAELDETLHLIFTKKQILRTMPDPSYNYWAHRNHTNCIIEEYVPSKQINVNNKPFDATMRIVFALHYMHETPHATLLNYYWKLPPCNLDQQGNLMDKHKSNIVTGRPCSAPVTDYDKALVAQVFTPVLSTIYEKTIFSTPFPA